MDLIKYVQDKLHYKTEFPNSTQVIPLLYYEIKKVTKRELSSSKEL